MSTIQDVTRQRLLAAAGPVFAEKGYEGATVREVCDAAGANLAAINYHFGGKENLYIETVRYAAEIIASQVPLPEWSEPTSPQQKLRDFLQAFLSRIVVDREPEWAGKLIMQEVFRPTSACITFVERFVQPTFRLLGSILSELLPPDLPQQKRRMIGFSIIGQCLHYRMARSVLIHLVGEEEFRSYHVDLLADHIASFTLAAIEAQYPSRNLAPQENATRVITTEEPAP